MRVQATLKSAGWTPDMGHAPRNWTYPNGKPVPAKTQAMLNDMLVNSGPKNQAPTVNQLMPGLKNIGNMGLSNNRTIINMLAQQQSGRSGGNEPSNRAPTPAPAPAPTSMPPEVANWFRYNLPAWGTGNAQNTTLQALLGLA